MPKPAARACCGLLAILLAVLGCVACVEYRVVRSDWDNFPQDPQPAAGDSNAKAARPQVYSVKLAAFTGPNRQNDVIDMIRRVRTQTGLTDLWVADTGEKSLLQVGRFRSPNDLDARFALRTARDAEIDGEKPFQDAQVRPIQTGYGEPGVEPDPHDLRQFAGTPDYHTLEVAIFTPAHGAFRSAAKKMTDKLREKDHEAFFYHGPNASSVTVGLFTRDDWDLVGTTEVYGPRIKSLRAEFPDLLVDGEKRPRVQGDPSQGYEPTKIVRVPSFR
jgi:hypothetical protein